MVQDPGPGMPALQGEMRFTGFGAVEVDPQLNQAADIIGAFGSQDLDGFAVVPESSGDKRVVDMFLDTVVQPVIDRGNPALRQAGVAECQLPLGKQQYPQLPVEVQRTV